MSNPLQSLPHDHPDYWQREVSICLYDHRPDAARAALARHHLGDLAATPGEARRQQLVAWVRFEREAADLGLGTTTEGSV